MAQVTYTAMLVSQASDASGCAGLFREAKETILRCRRAGLETGVWMADEQACAILGEILTVFDQQLATVPLEEFKVANESLKKIFSATETAQKVLAFVCVHRCIRSEMLELTGRPL